ncbi:HupE/UreJ family protein [Methylocucumis oryzae]|uniref:HupE/UreJ family protein n=1 Tax=Methylocucumis oryzae TaxID=1632867 RepID=UPI000696981B|nr:HupE/UreJ family protein [Methylocucumis oryzae]
MRRIVVKLFLLLASMCVFAHDPGLSSLEITVKNNELYVSQVFALQDIEFLIPMDIDLDADVSDEERDVVRPALTKLVVDNLQVRQLGTAFIGHERVSVKFDKQNNATFDINYKLSDSTQVTLALNLLTLFPDNHKQYVTVKNDQGDVVTQKMLSKSDSSIQLNVNSGVKPNKKITDAVIDFIELGIEHILTGYDHLLFLLALLIVTTRLLTAIKIISLFTLSHSITLVLAGLNIVELPSSIVEPIIAASIVYVGVENLFDKIRARSLVTFSFGFIHGFGFASVLKEMDISTEYGGIIIPLLSFNIGVELGQLFVAMIILSIVTFIKQKKNVQQ